MLQEIKAYIEQKQPPLVRLLHVIIILLAVSQLVISNFMEVEDGEIGRSGIEYLATWIHIWGGIALAAILPVFALVEFRVRGIKTFFPWLWGEMDQIRQDMSSLLSGKLPDANEKGLARTVQGLGFGAMLLTAFSGLLWYLLWRNQLAAADEVMEIHEALTSLAIAYIAAHGAMGILHLFLVSRKG